MTFKKCGSGIIPLLRAFCLPIALREETGLLGIDPSHGLRGLCFPPNLASSRTLCGHPVFLTPSKHTPTPGPLHWLFLQQSLACQRPLQCPVPSCFALPQHAPCLTCHTSCLSSSSHWDVSSRRASTALSLLQALSPHLEQGLE